MMLHSRLSGILLLVPALALVAVGCGKDTGVPKGPGEVKSGDGGGKAKPAAGGEKAPVEAKGVATLKGKVTFDGDPPKPMDLSPTMEMQQDKGHCLKGPTKDPTWMIGADKGVANVIVFVRAPEGKYFKLPPEQQSVPGEVTMDQPFCLFEPHVVALYPSFYDPDSKKQKETGQVFKIKNSAPINHNTAWAGNALINPGKNEILPKDKGEMIVPAKPGQPNSVGAEDLVNINCDIHKWMSAKAGVFDNPYHAVTDKDGNYEIKGVPAGAEVTVAHWHETFGKSLKDAKTEKVTLKEGANTQDFKIK